VVIASPDRIAAYRSIEHELSLDEIAGAMQDVDIILAEGYMRAGKPAIQVVRQETGLDLIGSPEQCIAIAADAHLRGPTPRYGLDDAAGLADLLERSFLAERSQGSPA
jgi:molybdopterin-guanine dinucleotide biosynthesis protein B